MPSHYRFALRPGWLALHLLTVALIVTMAILGHWQLDVSDAKHFSIQNFGYAIQWWLFATATLVLWGRLMRDAARHDGLAQPLSQPRETPAERGGGAGEQVAYRRYVMPSAQAAAADDVHTGYNNYLAQLAAADADAADAELDADSARDGRR